VFVPGGGASERGSEGAREEWRECGVNEGSAERWKELQKACSVQCAVVRPELSECVSV
jgi:hypothetical protein